MKVPFDANFFWVTFFVLLVPHEFSTGACPTPSGLEFVKTHHCAVLLWTNNQGLDSMPLRIVPDETKRTIDELSHNSKEGWV